VDTTTELQLTRVTKRLQNLIKMGGHSNKAAAELSRLEREHSFLTKVCLCVCATVYVYVYVYVRVCKSKME